MVQKEGYLRSGVDTGAAMQLLEGYIETFPLEFKQYSSGDILKKPAPDKWSKKEILGHLIDSAINNLKRFTDIQALPQPYTIVSYPQVDLVIINDYQNLPLDHLLDLWKALNRQIVFVVRLIPDEKFNFAVDPGYGNEEIRTLEWVICDYVAHMEHHFRQIFPSK